MAICVMAETLLAKSRHRIEGNSVTVHFSVLLCENADGDDEFIYWVILLDSVGEIVMKEIANDFITANDIYTRLKITLGPEHS